MQCDCFIATVTRPWILVLLYLVFTSSGLAQASSLDTFFDYPKTILNGAISAEPTLPAGQCRSVCAARSGCAGFSHIARDNICRMFSSIGSASEDENATSGSRLLIGSYRPPENLPRPEEPEQHDLVEEPAPPASVTFTLFNNRDLSGRPFSTRNSGSIDQCETLCRTNPGCNAFTYDRWNQKCFLKRQAGTLRMTAKSTSGVSNALSRPGMSGARVRFDYYNGRAFSGSGYRSLSASSRDACEAACSQQGRCIAFGFTPSQRRCTLFATAGEYSSRRGTYSGAKVQD